MGFRIDEVMEGTHEFEGQDEPGGPLPFRFSVTWGPPNLRAFLNPSSDTFGTAPLHGVITVGGLCEEVFCDGTIEIDYFGRHTIRYVFEFETDGTRYRFVGEKVNIRPWNLTVSHTTCFGTLLEADSGRLVSRSVTHFRLRTLPAFLASLRWANSH